jgi:transposase
MVLAFSRRIFVKGYLNEGMNALLDGHASAFTHFGGRTETILYDNPRTIVQSKDESNGQVVWNRTFKDRMDFYGVEIKLCRYYRAQTKGKVEIGYLPIERLGANNKATIWRRRSAYQDDFAARMDWTIKSYAEANHSHTLRMAKDDSDGAFSVWRGECKYS